MAVKNHNDYFKLNVTAKKYTNRLLDRLMCEYPYWAMVKAHYCCNGLKSDCWNDIYKKGVWGFTNDDVRNCVSKYLRSAAKELKRHTRFYVEEDGDTIHILAVLRDTKLQCDYRITASKTPFQGW